ncbi:unnamed protein product [Rotaria sordida]|uniref:Uncharacterized protein n=1 Tax=Rotaria sordida TaxID=392033 RepID=A0A814N6U9_9BILA|nr:unnamed protein product [Rotaria sordida]
MNHYFQTIIFALIILLISVQSFILIPPQDIKVTNNIRCYSSKSPILRNDYQLCAFRVYDGGYTLSQLIEYTIRDGIWYTNTFRQLIKRCHGFSTISDTGVGICPPLPYETFKNMTICICGGDLCNIDLGTSAATTSKEIFVTQAANTQSQQTARDKIDFGFAITIGIICGIIFLALIITIIGIVRFQMCRSDGRGSYQLVPSEE